MQVITETTGKRSSYVVLQGTHLPGVPSTAFWKVRQLVPEKVNRGHRAKQSVLQDLFSLIAR